MKRSKMFPAVFFFCILLLGAGIFINTRGRHDSDAPPPKPDPVPELKGALAVIIENHPNSRPQSGLENADIVYEMVSEGNITRLLALYYWEAAEKIGPTRSVRPYMVEIAKAYHAPLAHAGGSADGLQAIRTLKMPNLDEIHNASRYFWRSDQRRMPHNLYTSTDLLLEGAEAKNYEMTPLAALPEREDNQSEDYDLEESEDVSLYYEPAEYIDVVYSTSSRSPYATQYYFHEERYFKFVNNEPFLSDLDIPITADNVIVLIIPTGREIKDGETYADIKLLGSGQAVFFSKGEMALGTWQKSSPSDHFSYYIGNEPAYFSSGKTWVHIVPNVSSLTYRAEADTHPFFKENDENN